MTTHDFEYDARARARAKYGFYKHLAVYFAVNLMLVFINLATSPGVFWSIWPMFGWGIAILIHAVRVFVMDVHEEQIVDRLAEREQRRGEDWRK